MNKHIHISCSKWMMQLVPALLLCLTIFTGCAASKTPSLTTDATAENAPELILNAYEQGDWSTITQSLSVADAKQSARLSFMLANALLSTPENRQKRATDINELVQFSVQQNHVPAYHTMAQLYEQGIGLQQDILTATDWYRRHSRESTDKQPVTFYQKIGDELQIVSLHEYLHDLTLRARNSDVEAQYALARIYDLGQVTEVDMDAAVHWYNAAAFNGHSEAQFLLGYLYCRGVGVTADPDMANKWLTASERTVRCESNTEEQP